MLFCKALVLLGSAAATLAAPATDAGTTRVFDADAFDGEWYVALHNGQVKSCPKFEISHDDAASTSTIKEFIRRDDVSQADPLRKVTHTVIDAITASGPGMYSDLYDVTATFRGADAGFQKWAAFQQHIKGGPYDFMVFIVYSRQPQLSQEDENAAKSALKTAVQGEDLLQKVDGLFEPSCCFKPSPNTIFVAENFDGVWYPALHKGQVPKCVKFEISHNSAEKTTTITETPLDQTSSSGSVTHNVISTNIAKGPGMYTEGITVTNVFLGSDNYQNWAAFYQCVETKDGGASGHVGDFLIVYKKEKTINEEKLDDAKEEITDVLEKSLVDLDVSGLTEPNC